MTGNRAGNEVDDVEDTEDTAATMTEGVLTPATSARAYRSSHRNEVSAASEAGSLPGKLSVSGTHFGEAGEAERG